MVQYEWIAFGKTAPRRKSLADIVKTKLKTNWPTAYRDTSAIETPSEHILKPYNLKDDIGWGVSFKHFDTAKKKCTITAYVDDKYNDYTETKFSHGNSRLNRVYVSVDMAYRYTESITTLDDKWPIQFEGNKIMIDNILSDVTCLKSEGVHYIYKGRTIFDGRFSDEEIFLERLSRDADKDVFTIQNDMMWIYRKVYNLEFFENIKFY